MSNKVLISADCVCDIPVGMAEELNVSLIYYYIVTEEGKFRDGTEICTNQVLEYIEEDCKSAHGESGETEDYRNYFEELRKKTDIPIVHLCMSAKLSRAYERAAEAAKSFEQIYVIDTTQASGGMGHLVFQAAELANDGACVEMVLAMLEKNKNKVQSTFIARTTEGVFRSGGIGKTPHFLCKNLGLHPMVRIKDGRMVVFGFGMGNPYRYAKRYLKKILRKTDEIDPRFALLMYTSCSDELLRSIEAEMRKRVPFKRILVAPTYATVSCDLGSGCFGIIYIRK